MSKFQLGSKLSSDHVLTETRHVYAYQIEAHDNLQETICLCRDTAGLVIKTKMMFGKKLVSSGRNSKRMLEQDCRGREL